MLLPDRCDEGRSCRHATQAWFPAPFDRQGGPVVFARMEDGEGPFCGCGWIDAWGEEGEGQEEGAADRRQHRPWGGP